MNGLSVCGRLRLAGHWRHYLGHGSGCGADDEGRGGHCGGEGDRLYRLLIFAAYFHGVMG